MDRYQIALGHYMFCVHYHGGQWSELYAKLCRISEYLKLSPLWKDTVNNGPYIQDSQNNKRWAGIFAIGADV